jgi:signal transduction histidine kinase
MNARQALYATNLGFARYLPRMRTMRVIAGDAAELLEALLEALPDAVALMNDEGRIELENRSMRELRTRTAGGDGIDLTRDSTAGTAPDDLELDGGQRVFARYTLPVTLAAGTVCGRLIVLRETTVERDAEQLRDELFGLVSHELRTPLTSIIGYLDLVLDPEERLTDEQRQFLGVVHRNAGRLLRLVDDLLLTAQIEAGRIPVELEAAPVNLVDVLTEAVEAARPLARSLGIQLECETNGRGTRASERTRPGPIVRGDRDRLGQVIDNLISNALKFTPRSGRVIARLSESESEATVEISDSGPGVPLHEQARLFERFYRSSEAIDRAVPGVGLGLSIVKAIVESHGGRIGVRSDRSGGATFVLALPLDRHNATEA